MRISMLIMIAMGGSGQCLMFKWIRINNKRIRSNVGWQKDNEGMPADNVFGMSPDTLEKRTLI